MDTAEFDQRYEELFADLRRLCRAMGVGASAEDLAQEVLLYGRSRLGDLRDDQRLVPWLRRIAVRSAARARNAESRTTTTERDWHDEGLGQVELQLDQMHALGQLSRRQRQVVSLCYLLGYRQDEVAEMLGVSRGTVARTLWEARCRLATSLADADSGGAS